MQRFLGECAQTLHEGALSMLKCMERVEGRSSTCASQSRVDDTLFTALKDKTSRSMKASQLQFLMHFSMITTIFHYLFFCLKGGMRRCGETCNSVAVDFAGNPLGGVQGGSDLN